MKTRNWLCALLLIPAGVVIAQSPPSRVAFAEPGISPDGTEIAFVSGGDIWTMPAAGGTARLLVSHPATESRPLFSPDGRRLAFTSTRTGAGDIYVLTLDSGELKRVTYDDTAELVSGWSPDSQWIYFDSGAIDVGTAANTDVFRVRANGGTPMAVSSDRYVPEYYAAAAPDGTTIALNARGYAGVQWWRKGHSHLDESEIWLRKGDAYTRVTEGGAKEAWPMWQADGNGLLYVSDRSGAQNLWQRDLGASAKARQVTSFRNGRVLWPSISRDGRTVVFERDFQIWKLDVRSGQAAPVPIRRQGVPAGPATQRVALGGEWRDVALSPDGKKVALVGHGELFVAPRDGGDAIRITRTPGLEVEPVWSSDSQRLVYVSDRGGQPRIYEYDVLAGTEKAVTTGPDTSPAFSKDGKRLAFVRNDTELRVLDWDTRQERTIAQIDSAAPLITRSASSRPFAWSPDGKWIAFVDASMRDTRNVEIADPTGATPARQVTFLSNRTVSDVHWSADGAALLFRTGTRTETFRAARVDLAPRTPQFRESKVLDLFRDTPTPAAGGAADGGVVLDGIRDRLTLLPVGLDVNELRVSPDGKTAIVESSSTGQSNLYVYSLDPLAREPAVVRQLTATEGDKVGAVFTPDGKEVLYLDRGVLQSVPADASRGPRAIPVSADMEVDFHQEKLEVFRQGWSYLRDYFAFPDMNGVNWAGVRETYEPLIQSAATSDELRRLLQLMIGELNASHLGATAPASGGPTTGRLGLRFDRAQYEQSGSFVVAEVVPLSPAAVAGVKAGDRLLAVNGTPLDGSINLEALLDGTIGRQVRLTLGVREVTAQPVSIAAERALAYRAWVDRNRAYVEKASGGRLGYVHMQSMGAEMLDRLYVDLDTDNQSKDGVVIDLRANTGGFVAAHALDVFNRKTYIQVGRRGKTPASMRTWAGQRSLEKPSILVVNQASLSDAEDFTEGYRTFKMGTVVGEPTAGWFIGTNNINLLDGTVFRIAGSQGFASNGENMELHPRPVDIRVSRPIGETSTGRDSQLDVAVKTLLDQIGRK